MQAGYYELIAVRSLSLDRLDPFRGRQDLVRKGGPTVLDRRLHLSDRPSCCGVVPAAESASRRTPVLVATYSIVTL